MYYLIGKKEYVYYFAEYMMSEMKSVQVPDYIEQVQIESLICELNYEIINKGKYELVNDFVESLTLQQFTNRYLILRKNKNLIAGSLKEMDKYCSAIENFYKNAQSII